MVVPAYVGEMAPPARRGAVVITYELMLCFGQGLTLLHFSAQLEDLREHIAHVRAQLEHLRDTSTGLFGFHGGQSKLHLSGNGQS